MELETPPPTAESIDVPGYALLQGGAAAPAHNEAAFRHFLSVELRRAERSGHSLLLVLVGVRPTPSSNAPMSSSVASAVFSALGEAIREIDFVGWFRMDRVAAAVLVQRNSPQADLGRRIADRVTDGLRGDLAKALRVRVVTLRGRPEI
jgi:hypothetical protein